MTDTMTPEELRAYVAKTMTERELQAQIKEMAEAPGWLYYHTYNSRRSNPGFPDVVLVRNGDLIFAELKIEGEEPTSSQTEWLEALRMCERWTSEGIEVYVWRPSDLDEIERRLNKQQ